MIGALDASPVPSTCTRPVRLGSVPGALGASHDQRAAAVGDQAAFQQVERVGDGIRDASTSSTVIGSRSAARGFVSPTAAGPPPRRRAAGASARLLHVPQQRDGERGRVGPNTPYGTLELAPPTTPPSGTQGGAPTRDRPDSPWVISTVRAYPARIAAAACRTCSRNAAAADAGAVDPARRDAERVRHLDRPRRATVAIPSMSRSDRPASAIAFSAPSTCSCSVEWSGKPAEPVGLGRPTAMMPPARARGHRSGPNTGRLRRPVARTARAAACPAPAPRALAARPTMLVIIRRPSSSSTTAIAYGPSPRSPAPAGG